MPIEPTVTGRRGFLARLTAAAAALATAGTPTLAAAATGTSDDAPEPWLRALKGKHRQLFYCHNQMDGTVLYQAKVFIDRYREAYGVPADQLNVVVAAHGNTGGILLNDAIWSKYSLGAMYKVTVRDPAPPAAPADSAAAAAAKGPPRIAATRNPFYAPQPGDVVGADVSVDALMKLGVTFLICDNALQQFAAYTARRSGTTVELAHKELTDNLVPGAVLVPTMLIAVNRAQEHGCSYLFSV